MAQDTIVEETRRIREGLAKAHGYNVKRIVRALQQEEAKSGQELVKLPSRSFPNKKAG